MNWQRSHLYLILLLAMLDIAMVRRCGLPAEPASVSIESEAAPVDAGGGELRFSFAQAAADALKNEEFQPEIAAAPPAEPEMPAWGNYLQPNEVPVALPPLQYDIVGAPRGVMQNIQGQTYRRTVADPNTLLVDDIRMDKALNLSRPDGLAPVGVFNDHMLPVGAMLISYRYLSEGFDGIYVGSHQVGKPGQSQCYLSGGSHEHAAYAASRAHRIRCHAGF